MDNKMNRLRMSNVQNGNLNQVSAQMGHEKILKAMHNERIFDRDIFNEGQRWYENGNALEDAPIELRGNMAFINGYERGKRLGLITKTQTGRGR